MSERDRLLMEDLFADALDAMTLGVPSRTTGDDSLARSAASIQVIGGHMALESGAMPPPVLDRAAKSRIWSELMREHGNAPDRAATPRAPGGAASALSLNPWAEEQTAEPPKRPRSSSGVLRFVPAAQPASSFMLVIAVLVLIGGAFASLAPDGGRGIFPSVQATEDPANLAVATPEASPTAIAGECEPVRSAYSFSPDSPYRYDRVGTVPNFVHHDLRGWFSSLTACMTGPPPAGFAHPITERLVDDLQGFANENIQNFNSRAAVLHESWVFPLGDQTEILRYVWPGSEAATFAEHLNVLPGTASRLADGRIGLVATIAPAAVSPVPDQSWIGSDLDATHSVVFFGLIQFDRGFVVDEMFDLCNGQSCVEMFGSGDIAPIAGVHALQTVGAEECTVETGQLGDIGAGTDVYTFQDQRSFLLRRDVY